MTDRKISDLNNITGANLADADEFVVVDASADETKAITFSELKEAFDTSTGFVRITGDTMTGDLSFNGGDTIYGDSDKAIFGAGSDLQIYHDGSASIITESGAGNLKIQGSNIEFVSATGEDYASFLANGAARFHYDNALKLATTSTGIDVTGTVTADGLTVGDGTGAESIRLDKGASSAATIEFYSGGAANGKIEYNAFEWLVTNSVGQTVFQTAAKDRLNISANGDISFYEDTGTTPKFFWDASAEALGIGTSSPNSSARLDVQGGRLYLDAPNEFTLRLANSGTAGAFIGTSAANTLNFYNGTGTERMRIDASGNLGLGVTPSAASLGPAFQIANGAVLQSLSGGFTELTNNAIYNSGFKYIGTGPAVGYELGANGHKWLTAPSGTAGNAITFSERMRIDSSGHAIIPAGVTLGTSAGVYNAANTLDDYEEGAWTPTLVGHTTAGSYTITPASNSATYVKVGKIVHVAATMTITVNSAGTGLARFGGLPFTSGGNTRGMGPVRTSNVSLPASTLFAVSSLWTSNTTDFSLSCTRDNASLSTLDVSGISSGDVIDFRMTYETT